MVEAKSAAPFDDVFGFIFIDRQDTFFGNVMFEVDRLHVQGPPRDIEVTSPLGSHTFVHAQF